jgi:hypothetical protein
MKIKYSHLSSQKLKSSYTKSKNLHIYLYFIDFSDPSQIPFIDVARVTGEKPAKIRGMMKNAWNNDKISLGLVDVGVDPADIPEWFARPRRLKLRSKRPAVNKLPARVPTEPRTRPIQVAKKYIIPVSQSFNAQPITQYGPNFYEPRNTPETDEVWRLITRNIQKQTALDLEEHLDEQKSRKTLRERIAERKAWIAQQEMERSARAAAKRQIYSNFNLSRSYAQACDS